MNSMCKFLCILTAVVMAAFALPAVALDKQFNITVTPAPPTPYLLPAGQTTNVTVKFTNLSSGNSNISSLILTLAGVTVNNTASAGTVTLGSPILSPSGSVVACPSGTPAGSICVANISNGIKPGNSLTVTVAVTPVAPFVCANAAWVGQAFAGSSFGTQVFSDPATGATNSQVGVFVGCDIIACGGSFTSPQNLQSDDPGYAQVFRSAFNKDGASGGACTVVPYSFANTILNNDANKNKVNLVWYTQATAVFILSTNSQLRTVDSGTNWTNAKRPRVAWLPATTTLGGLQTEIDAPACLATNPLSSPVPNLPGPYGTLTSAITTTGSVASITVNVPGSLPAGWAPLPTTAPPPFPIVIGGERFQVTVVTGSAPNYTLTLDTGLGAGGRGVGGTSVTTHPLGALVNSSPLPLLVGYSFDSNQTAAGYVNGMQAQICVQDYGWAASNIDPVSGAAQIFDFATAIATGDLTVRFP